MKAREHVHLIAVGGTGMTALAGLLAETGCKVTGSDVALYPPTSEILARLDVDVRVGFDPANLDPVPDLVVIGNAVRRGNPEAEEVLDRDLEYASMPEVLARRFLARRHAIVVAGTHGKTTTTSMIAHVLERAGLDPGFLIGGLPVDFELPFRSGRGPFVVEGDEYDTAFFDKSPKFMHYRPDTAIVGTVEFDHADIFRDLEHVRRVFGWFVNTVPRRGLLLRDGDCEETRRSTVHAPCRVQEYGLEGGAWRAVDVAVDRTSTSFSLLRDGTDVGRVVLSVSGPHNVRNALAAIAACHEQGVALDRIIEGLGRFSGVRRRLEERGRADGVVVFDDFAHHPTAIATTLATVRLRYPSGRVWAVLEPRSWSMRRNVFQERLPRALAAADAVVISSVYRAEQLEPSERLDVRRVVSDIGGAPGRAEVLDGADAILERLVERVAPGDVVVVMSNGGFDGLHDRLLDALRERGEAR